MQSRDFNCLNTSSSDDETMHQQILDDFKMKNITIDVVRDMLITVKTAIDTIQCNFKLLVEPYIQKLSEFQNGGYGNLPVEGTSIRGINLCLLYFEAICARKFLDYMLDSIAGPEKVLRRQNKYRCINCTKRYFCKAQLTLHDHYMHKEPRFKCILCSFKSHEKYRLKDHIFIHHKTR